MRITMVCVAAVLALLAAAPAYAGSHFSIGFYSTPAPVYYQPAPVYYAPRPVAYYPPAYYYQPQPVVYYPRPYYPPSYGYRVSFVERDRRRNHHERRQWR
jgi:hypothetical protein